MKFHFKLAVVLGIVFVLNADVPEPRFFTFWSLRVTLEASFFVFDEGHDLHENVKTRNA